MPPPIPVFASDGLLLLLRSVFSNSTKCFGGTIDNIIWVTLMQVKLCGHATLAAAHTLFSSGLVHTNIIEFVTLSGLLTAKRIQAINISGASNLQNGETEDGFYIELDFPADPVTDFNLDQTSLLSRALIGASIIDIRRTQVTDDLLVILKSSLFHIYHTHDKYFPENRISLRMRKTILSSLCFRFKFILSANLLD